MESCSLYNWWSSLVASHLFYKPHTPACTYQEWMMLCLCSHAILSVGTCVMSKSHPTLGNVYRGFLVPISDTFVLILIVSIHDSTFCKLQEKYYRCSYYIMSILVWFLVLRKQKWYYKAKLYLTTYGDMVFFTIIGNTTKFLICTLIFWITPYLIIVIKMAG